MDVEGEVVRTSWSLGDGDCSRRALVLARAAGDRLGVGSGGSWLQQLDQYLSVAEDVDAVAQRTLIEEVDAHGGVTADLMTFGVEEAFGEDNLITGGASGRRVIDIGRVLELRSETKGQGPSVWLGRARGLADRRGQRASEKYGA